MWRKRNTCALLVGMRTGAATVWRVLKELQIELPYDPVFNQRKFENIYGLLRLLQH